MASGNYNIVIGVDPGMWSASATTLEWVDPRPSVSDARIVAAYQQVIAAYETDPNTRTAAKPPAGAKLHGVGVTINGWVYSAQEVSDAWGRELSRRIEADETRAREIDRQLWAIQIDALDDHELVYAPDAEAFETGGAENLLPVELR